MPKAPIWQRDFTLLWITNFLMATSFYFLLPTVPLYVTNVLGADKSQVGLLISIYTVSALAFRPLAGYLLDTMGRKVTYLAGLGLFALFIFPYGWASSFAMLLGIRFLHGIAWGALTTGGATVAADLLPAERRGEGLGYYGLTMAIAMAIGPLLGQFVSGGGKYGQLFVVAGGIATAALLLGFAVRYPKLPSAGHRLSLDSFVDRQTLPMALVCMLYMATYGGVISFIVLFAAERGLNGSIFFPVYALALGLSRPLGGRLQDRHGPNLILGSGLVSLALGFTMMAFSYSLGLFVVAAIFLGIGMGYVGPTLQVMSLSIVPPQRRGVASSTLFSAGDLGMGLGSTLLGWVADAYSLGTMFLTSAALIVIPLVAFYTYVRPYYKHEVERLKHGRSA